MSTWRNATSLHNEITDGARALQVDSISAFKGTLHAVNVLYDTSEVGH